MPSAIVAAKPYTIPLAAIPSQTLAVDLGGQACRIVLHTRVFGLFIDVFVSDVPVAQGVLCLDRTPLVRAAYRGFIGELVFIDSQGVSDPTYDGFGTRYNLVWLAY